MQLNKNIIISFLCAFAPLRDKIRANPQIKKMENEPNCNDPDVAASNCYRNAYNDFYHKIRQKNEPKRTQLKPIKANFSEHKERGAQATRQKNPHNSGNNQTKNKKMKSKPNFTNLFRAYTVFWPVLKDEN